MDTENGVDGPAPPRPLRCARGAWWTISCQPSAENGGAWALRAAGLTVAPEAEASPQPDGNALAETPEDRGGRDFVPLGGAGARGRADAGPGAGDGAGPPPPGWAAARPWTAFPSRIRRNPGVDLYEELQIDPDVHVKRDGSPVVLLYSTHASESFLLSDTDWYYTDDDFRSTEPDESILSVAAEAAAVIEAGGFGVIHDTTLHDYPAYSGSYDRSMETIRKNLEAYPTIQITVDRTPRRVRRGRGRHALQAGRRGQREGRGADHDPHGLRPLRGPALSRLAREPALCAAAAAEGGKRCSRGCTGRCFFHSAITTCTPRTPSVLVEVGTEVNTLSEAQYSGTAARRDDPRGSERPCGIGAPRRGHTRVQKTKKRSFCTMHSRFRTRPFLISFLCTALALLFLVGILVVDAEGRRLSFNDTSPRAGACLPCGRHRGHAGQRLPARPADRRDGARARLALHRRLFLHPARAISRGGECVCVCRVKTAGGPARDCFAPVSRIAFEHIIRTQRCIR